MVLSKTKKLFINNAFILYYGFMPILATIFYIFKLGVGSFSYILALNISVALLAFIYYIHRGNFKMERYQRFFLIFVIIAICFDYARGEFWTTSKTTIESVCMVLSSTIFVLTPKIKKVIIRLFIFYIISSFVIITIQRIYGIYWGTTFEIEKFTSDEFQKFRFIAYWLSIDTTSGVTVFSLITAIVCIELLTKGHNKFAILIISMVSLSSVLSGSRALMMYVLILIFAFILYKRKSILRSITKSITILVFFITGFLVLDNYGISLERIWKDRIYQSDVSFEERPESARIDNINFFFSSKYFNLYGNGYAYDPEYQKESGRNHPGLLIGMLNPIFAYGIVSVFYYLFLFALFKKTYKYYRLTKDLFFIALIIGFIAVGFTAGFTFFSHMHAFFFFLFLKTYYEEAVIQKQIAKEEQSLIAQ